MVATRSTRQTDGLVTDGEALSIPRSVNCWKVEYELTLSCVLAGAAQREQHDFTREQLVSLHPPNPHASMHPALFGQLSSFTFLAQSLPPAFSVMAKQMPDTEVESQQLFPLLHGSIGPH